MPKGNPVLKGRRAPGDRKPSKKVMKMRKRRSRWIATKAIRNPSKVVLIAFALLLIISLYFGLTIISQ